MNTLTPADASRLLALAASYDNRRPDDTGAAARSWAKALGGLRFEDCIEAIHLHYRDSTDFLMPAMIRRLATPLANERARLAAREQRAIAAAQPADPETARQSAARIRSIIGKFGTMPA